MLNFDNCDLRMVSKLLTVAIQGHSQFDKSLKDIIIIIIKISTRIFKSLCNN